MFKIGDFSKLCRVPIKTLRYYDEIGLLKPNDINRFTRYRYYTPDQLPRLYRILVMKDLGLTLEQIGHLLDVDLTSDQLRGMLLMRKMEIEHEAADVQAQLERITARLRQIELEGKLPEYEIVIKQVEPVWVASLVGTIQNYLDVSVDFGKYFDQVHQFLSHQGVRNPGCGMAIYENIEEKTENITVDIAVQIPGPIPNGEQVRVYQLPQVEAASVVHHGPFSTVGKAYYALSAWTEANGFMLDGPSRELYLFYPRGQDQTQAVTEVQFPVSKMKKEWSIMEPKIVKKDKFIVVGMPYLGKNENKEIAQMWGAFMPRISEIKHLLPGPEISYGVCFPNDQGLVDYVAALPVTQLADIPAGMVGKEIPAQTYAVFEAHGIPDIMPTYIRIQKEWLPKSGYKPGKGPDFEFYPETFDDEKDPASVLYIYFPVERA